ncbi:peptidase M19 [Lysobacteraceae bacterium NML07-0707]|nr:peptidase M19 [Xanthomonadaceae bacterium NML07-0707]
MKTALTAIALALLSTPLLANPPSDEARQLAQKLIIVDTHIDAPGMLQDGWRDLSGETDREFDWPKSRAGGLDVAFMSIYTSAAEDAAGTAYGIANQQIDAVWALASRAPDKFAVLTSPRDIPRLRRNGRVLLPLGMENGAPLAGKIENLHFFYKRGVRYITLAHSAANALADSSYGAARKWNGLSPFGREVVTEMNRLGMMVDVSHISDDAAAEAIALSRAPVIASHSAFRHFTPDFERNISDALAKAVAASGGVVQIPFGTAFVNPQAAANLQAKFRQRDALQQRNAAARAAGQPEESVAEWEAAWAHEHPRLSTDIEAVLAQIDYGVKLVGIDHIGIGSDFDGVGGELPEQLRSVADFPRLIDGLKARGYSETDIGKIMGGNLLRVWREVEALALVADRH